MSLPIAHSNALKTCEVILLWLELFGHQIQFNFDQNFILDVTNKLRSGMVVSAETIIGIYNTYNAFKIRAWYIKNKAAILEELANSRAIERKQARRHAAKKGSSQT